MSLFPFKERIASSYSEENLKIFSDINYKSKFAVNKIGKYLSEFIDKNTALVCIGTDLWVIDCLGPLVGTMLLKEAVPIDIYGTVEASIHVNNFEKNLELISRKNYTRIIVVNSCLSSKREIGTIYIRQEPTYPGSAAGHSLPGIGDISVKCIIGKSDKSWCNLHANTRLSLIISMAKTISEGIINAVDRANIK